MPENFLYPEFTKAAGVVRSPICLSACPWADIQDHWSINTAEHRLFDQNLEAAMVYVRLVRQNLSPTPSVSPVPGPTEDLLAVFERHHNLDATCPFEPKALRKHFDQIISVFAKHMTDELQTLTKEKVAQIGEMEYAAIDKRLRDMLRAHGPEWFLCITFGQYLPS